MWLLLNTHMCTHECIHTIVLNLSSKASMVWIHFIQLSFMTNTYLDWAVSATCPCSPSVAIKEHLSFYCPGRDTVPSWWCLWLQGSYQSLHFLPHDLSQNVFRISLWHLITFWLLTVLFREWVSCCLTFKKCHWLIIESVFQQNVPQYRFASLLSSDVIYIIITCIFFNRFY